MTIEALLTENNTLLRELIAAVKANGGNAAVGGGAADTSDKLKKATHFHIIDKRQVVRVDAGGERPLGGVEVTAAEAKKLDEKYKAEAGAKNESASSQGSQTGAAAAQTGSTGTAATGSGQSEPTFEDVTAAITALSKKPAAEGGGREAVVKLLTKWGVKTFPEAQGKKSNAALIADIKGEPEEAGADDMSALGL